MKKVMLLLIAFLISHNAFAECALANDRSSYGTACSSISRKEAEDKAIVRCGKSGGQSCVVIAHFETGCWAIAKDRALEISAYSFGKSTLDEAKSESISSCVSHGGKNCINTPNVGCEGQKSNMDETNTSKYKKI